MTRSLVKHVVLSSAAVLLALAARAEKPRSLVANGGFEELTHVAGVAKDGGKHGSWFVYMLKIQSDKPHTFRWSDDLVKGYKWTAAHVPITWEWQKLSNGIEVKFNKRDLVPGHMICFHARDQLVSKIERIDGTKLILADQANRSATDAVVRHSDSAALQMAVNHAIGQRKDLFVPNGYYRLT